MTAYNKQTWADGVAGGTPISATRLAHMEDGIADPLSSIPANTFTEVPLSASKIIYVTPQGNDANDGRWIGSNHAVATIRRAKAILGYSAGIIKLGYGTFAISDVDPTHQTTALTLDYPGQVLESESLLGTVINITATGLTWGIKIQAAACRISNLLVYIHNNTTYGVGVSCEPGESIENSVIEHVNCTFLGGKTGTAVFAFGPDHYPASDMDIAQIQVNHCYSVSSTPGNVVSNYLWGNGASGNVAQNSMFSCMATGARYGITLDGAGMCWTAGGFSACTLADINHLAPCGDLISFFGSRHEGGNQLVRSDYSGYTYGGLAMFGCVMGPDYHPTADGTNIISWNNTSPIGLYRCTILSALGTETIGVNTSHSTNVSSLTAIDCTTANPNAWPAYAPTQLIRTILNATYRPGLLAARPNPNFIFVVDRVKQVLGAAATDAASTMALANAIRTALINDGLGTT